MQKLKYVSEYSLLVHTSKYGLMRIKCPFTVITISTNTILQYRKRYKVDRVIKSEDFKILYQIDNKTYRYNIFKILLNRNQK